MNNFVIVSDKYILSLPIILSRWMFIEQRVCSGIDFYLMYWEFIIQYFQVFIFSWWHW